MDVVTGAAHEPPGHVTAARTETKRPHDAGRMQTGVHNDPGCVAALPAVSDGAQAAGENAARGRGLSSARCHHRRRKQGHACRAGTQTRGQARGGGTRRSSPRYPSLP